MRGISLAIVDFLVLATGSHTRISAHFSRTPHEILRAADNLSILMLATHVKLHMLNMSETRPTGGVFCSWWNDKKASGGNHFSNDCQSAYLLLSLRWENWGGAERYRRLGAERYCQKWMAAVITDGLQTAVWDGGGGSARSVRYVCVWTSWCKFNTSQYKTCSTMVTQLDAGKLPFYIKQVGAW